MICKKCGNEMNVVKQELSCSCICSKCNWLTEGEEKNEH